MIKQNELRQGNYIKDSLGRTVIVQGIGIPDGLFYSNQYGVYSDHNENFPIPLTSEILLACGFLLEENKVRFGKSYSTRGEWITFSMMEHNKGFWIIINTAHNEGINVGTTTSLHQLQNLYFALTGTELNYSPELLKPTN